MEYRIAIPSYNRANVLQIATLATLAKYGVDPKLITVFVANDEEYRVYREVVPSSVDLVVSEPGLVKSRQWYHRNYYDKGTPLVNLDDDIYDIHQKAGDKLEPFTGTFDQIVETGFSLAEKYHSGMWAINPANNGFYLKDEVTVGLRLACGIFHGNYAGDRAVVGRDRPSDLSSGEDFETTLRSFLMNGAIVRMEWLTPITKFFAPGGMDAEIADRQRDNAIRLAEICARYPDLASLKTKAGGVTSIRLKSQTYAREPRVF